MPMRPANTVRILERRLSQAEIGEPDAMELVSLHDELARVERKWLMQFARNSERRKPDDREKLIGWYRRLKLLIERKLRISPPADEAEQKLLQQTLAKCEPQPSPPQE